MALTNEKIQIDSSVETKEALLTFLHRTKDGAYAKIEQTSTPYARMKETGEVSVVDGLDDVYFYSVS